MSDPMTPLPAQPEPMRRGMPQASMVNLVVLVVAVFLVMAALLAVLHFSSQSSLNTIQENQTGGAVTRQQTLIMGCAIWESRTAAERAGMSAARTAAANRICAAVTDAVPFGTATPKG